MLFVINLLDIKNRAVTVAIREIYVSSIVIMVSVDIWIYAKTQFLTLQPRIKGSNQVNTRFLMRNVPEV